MSRLVVINLIAIAFVLVGCNSAKMTSVPPSKTAATPTGPGPTPPVIDHPTDPLPVITLPTPQPLPQPVVVHTVDIPAPHHHVEHVNVDPCTCVVELPPTKHVVVKHVVVEPPPEVQVVVEQKPEPVVQEDEVKGGDEACGNDFRVGAGTINANFDLEKDPRYFDTDANQFCDIKAIRVVVLGKINGFNQKEFAAINHIFFAYEKKAAKGPFAAKTQVSQNLRKSESTDWIPVPDANGSCLKKVRVEAEGAYNNPEMPGGDTMRVVVCGVNAH